MRVWDLPVHILCDKHLLGQHREIHCMWNVITLNKKGYSRHPETMRWKKHLSKLYDRHEQTKNEMIKRGFNHKSEVKKPEVYNLCMLPFINTIEEQVQLLKKKGCKCKI